MSVPVTMASFSPRISSTVSISMNVWTRPASMEFAITRSDHSPVNVKKVSSCLQMVSSVKMLTSVLTRFIDMHAVTIASISLEGVYIMKQSLDLYISTSAHNEDNRETISHSLTFLYFIAFPAHVLKVCN